MILGVADARIASAVNELFSITCQHTGVVPELLRGKNLNFDENLFSMFFFSQVFDFIFRIWSKV